MEEVILDVSTLPEPLLSRIHSEKVKIQEADGIIMLIPVIEKAPFTSRLQGMFADGRLSTEKFLTQKRLDKELEQ